MSVSSQPSDFSDLQLRSLLDASPVGMLVFNDRLEVVLANPPAERLFGITDRQRAAGRCGDAISCANRLTSQSGCGYSAACPNCLLFRGLKTTLAGTAAPVDQEGEVELHREAGCAPLWIRFKIRPLQMGGMRCAILTIDDISDLRQSERRYAMLFREMHNAFAVHEILEDDRQQPADYRFLSVNPAFERVTGLSAAQVVGRTAREIFPDLEAELIETYGTVVRTGEPIHFEYFLRQVEKYFSITAFRPAPGQFACLFEDISERRQAAQRLERSEANYRSAYTLLRSMCDNVPDMIWAKDLDRNYLFANSALCRDLLNAADTAEPIGRSDLFFAERERARHAEDRQWHTFGELCRDSDTATMDAGTSMHFDEFGNVRGRFLFLDVHKAPFLDGNGKMIGTVGSARDVTAVKDMERQLREREERLNLAIQGADLGTWDWHVPSGRIVANRRWAEMLGYAEEELEPFLDFRLALVHPDDSRRVKDALARHLAGETEAYESQHRLRHSSGEWIWVLDKGRVTERDEQGAPLRACGTHLDITRQKVLIEQSRDGIVILDSQGRVREANRRFADMLGYTPEEVLHLHVWDWDTRWTREQLLQAVARADAAGDFFETRHRRKDGTVFPVEISTNGSIRTGDKLVFCICRDISERKKTEELLVESENSLRQILNSLRPHLAVLDERGVITEVNDAWRTFAAENSGGGGASLHIGANYLEICRHAMKEEGDGTIGEVFQGISGVLEGRMPSFSIDYDCSSPKQLRWFHLSVLPLRGGGKGAVISHENITERKRLELDLKRRDALLDTAVRISGLLLASKSPTAVLPEIVRLIGETSGQDRASYFTWRSDGPAGEVTVSLQHQWVAEGIAPQLDNPVLHDLPFSRVAPYFCEQVRRGLEVCSLVRKLPAMERAILQPQSIVSLLLVPVMVDGAPEGFLGFDNCHGEYLWTTGERAVLAVVAANLGAAIKRSRAEEALRASEKRFQGILQNVATVAVQGYAMDGTVRYWNHASESFYGYAAEEAVGKNLLDLIIPAEMQDAVRAAIAQMMATGEAIPAAELALKRKDGSLISVYSSHAIVRIAGQDPEFFCIDTDLTERKLAESDREKLLAQLTQAQKMESIGTLAGGIAHDFNNILGAVFGYAEMAREDSAPGSAAAHNIGRVLEAAQRAASLVRQILAFTRQQASERILLAPEPILVEVVKLLRPSLPSTIAIVHRVDTAARILADPAQFHQVLMNLATNAFQAMEEAGGRLEISIGDTAYGQADLAVHPGIEPGDFVRITVSDNGPGIPPEIRDRIFDPYFTTKEVGKGTGIGLAIVDRIVRDSGGFITCESGPGRGTTFTIALPVFEGEPAGVTKEGEARPGAGGSGRILLVDDEELLVNMGKSMLERLGYEVTALASSVEALAVFRKDPFAFDAVVTDQTMPEMTGFDLARQMLAIRPGLPVVLLTGYSNLVNEAKARACGIKGFAMKPLSKNEIASLLREVLEE